MNRFARMADEHRTACGLNKLCGRAEVPLRRRFKWRATKLLCIAATNGRCWWGRPYRSHALGHQGRRVVRCRICRSVWSNWESFRGSH